MLYGIPAYRCEPTNLTVDYYVLHAYNQNNSNLMMTNKEKLKVRRHFSYSLLSAAVGMLSSSGGDGIWEELEVIA